MNEERITVEFIGKLKKLAYFFATIEPNAFTIKLKGWYGATEI
jgi:hypothetical protein